MSKRKVHEAIRRLRAALAEEGITEVNLKLGSMDDGVVFARLFDLQPRPLRAPNAPPDDFVHAWQVVLDAETWVSWTSRSKAAIKAQRDQHQNRVRLRRENCPPIGAVS